MPGICTEDGSQIDILIVYTPLALAGAGGLPALQTQADDAIAELNTVFATSGIATTAVLVGFVETNFNESGSTTTHLSFLRNPNDGIMDEVHGLRDSLRADLVCLFTQKATVCGVANLSVEAGFSPRPDLGFSVVSRTCLGGGFFVFSHEIGHNLGLLHDVAADSCLLTGADQAAHGFEDAGGTFQTVMATGLAARVPQFSDPAVTVGGLPAGVAGESDNASVAMQSVITVSRHRDRDQDGDGTCDADQIAFDASLDCNLNGVLDQFDIDFNQNGSPDECEIALDANLDLDLDGVPDAAELPILRVNVGAAPGGSGGSWAGAIDDLQFALALARASGDVSEIWIAQGTYTPGVFKALSFDLVGGVALYGGFNGTELLRSERDPKLQVTILSGDLAGDDDPDFINRSDNSVTVVYGFQQAGLCTLDGLTVTGGYSVESRFCLSTASGTGQGGGIFALFCDVEINNCVFMLNAAKQGGGLFLPDITSWRITGTDIIANRAIGEWQAADSGGAFLSGSQLPAEMTDCRVLGNVSDGSAGGVFFIGGVHTVNNVLFSGNRMVFGNSAFWVRLTTGSLFNNLTVVNNQADANWSVGGPNFDPTSVATLSNSILWGNKIRAVIGPVDMSERRQLQSDGTLTLENCIIQGWTGTMFGGVANNGDDPLLVDVLGLDGLAGTTDDDAHLSAGSPAIDSGNNTFVSAGVTSDLDGAPRFVDDVDTFDTGVGAAPQVDRGAYEFQVAAPPVCLGDANSDGIVNFSDITSVLSNWLSDYTPGTGPGDANGDSIVNFGDITSVLSNWLFVCP